MYDLINNLEKTYKNGGLYKNNYLGIFDTGVEALKVSDENSRKLIDLFIKINCLHGFDNCYRCLNESFINNIKGIKTKVISPILHCLKPNYFPILNSACISSKIFESLGIGINSPYEISTYISNILKIMNFRDKNFKFKNYRIFEIEANKKIQFEDEYKTIYAYITDSSILTCSTQIVTKDWMEKIAEPKNKVVLNLLIDWYNAPNHEMSCEEANDNFKNLGKDIDSYNLILKFCNEVNRDLKITIKKDDTVFNYLVLVDERNGIYKENQVKSWILKTEICEALESLGIVKKIESSKFIEKYTIDDFLNDVFISKAEYDEIYRQLVRKKNVILQGSPGVGKSYMAKKLAFAFIGEKNEENIEMVQFHQSYSYEDFIYGYKPNGNEFKLTPGIFYSFCKKAEKSDKPFFFIIDEINRGNLSKIFGELLMLIESDKRENCSLTLSHSKERFSVPSNLYIIGLMNTADRSLAIIDYALRRRFAFIDVNPAFNSEKFKEYLLDHGTEEAMVEKVINRICELNKTIEEDLTLGKNFEIGHSYFCDTNQALTEEKFKEIIKFDIIPILKEYWFDNPNKAKEAIEKLLD